MRKMIRRPEGFTLIELMIVILIIAILVAIAVPVFLNARSNAQKRTCQANIRTVDSSIQSYEATMETGLPPSGMAVMTEANTKTLKAIPTCPQGAGTYAWLGSLNPPEISCPFNGAHKI